MSGVVGQLVVKPLFRGAIDLMNAQLFGVAKPENAAAYGFSFKLLERISFMGLSKIIGNVVTQTMREYYSPYLAARAVHIGEEIGEEVAAPIAIIAGLVGGYFMANSAGYPITFKEITCLMGILTLECMVLSPAFD